MAAATVKTPKPVAADPFADVKPQTAEKISHQRAGRASTPTDPRFIEWVKDSYNAGENGARKLTVRGEHGKAAVRQLRRAADELGYGMSFGHKYEDEAGWKDQPSVTVHYHAKIRTSRPRKEKSAE